MGISRRNFLKIMGASAALAFPGVMIQGCRRALERAAAKTPVLWVRGLSCSGCTSSLLNGSDPGFLSLIHEHIALGFHPAVMTAAGGSALGTLNEAAAGNLADYILVVEGAVPTGDDAYRLMGTAGGRREGVAERVRGLARNARFILAAGTCASYGGVQASRSGAPVGNPAGAKSITDFLGDSSKIINTPGCPPHPDWFAGTLMGLLLRGTMPELDEYRRPRRYYGKTVHSQCGRLAAYKRGVFAEKWGDEGCLYRLGCLGMDSGCDNPRRKWLGVNSCTGSASGCIGCTEPPFPDFAQRGLYRHEMAGAGPNRPGADTAETRSTDIIRGGGIHG
jgi:hydrogenase small subunit